MLRVLLNANPASLIRPKVRKKEALRALTPYETQRVLETIDRHRHGLFLATFYYLGLRRSEALGLKWGDFDWEEGLVHVQRDIDTPAALPRMAI